jgi:hypothetical protein
MTYTLAPAGKLDALETASRSSASRPPQLCLLASNEWSLSQSKLLACSDVGCLGGSLSVLITFRIENSNSGNIAKRCGIASAERILQTARLVESQLICHYFWSSLKGLKTFSPGRRKSCSLPVAMVRP